ncbi:MAG: insulinase family protein [Desulfuromonas sp.]|uniref:M16 family metallopeptidase n=1 Tax=Desulfuromonas sp. TaxID=892 RepID=UPI000CC8A6C6|nr:pitrilysin family protein [Desulfuromonas sp.]PLX82810.1 MAG: insulinase family protein [Desulfuromonas sp.]
MNRLRCWALILLCFVLTACSARMPLHPDQMQFSPLAFELPQVERLVLPNGIRLFLKEDHELPLVSVTAMIGAGSIGDPATKTGQGGVFASLLRTGGAGEMSPEALDEKLEHLAADFSATSDTYTTTLGLSLRSGDLRAGLGVLADVLRRPGFDVQRLELARKQAVEGVRRQDDDPGAVAQRTFMKALYGDHPLGRTPTEKTLQAVTREDLVAFHRRYSHPENLWLGISGDFSRGELKALLEELFGSWEGGAFRYQDVPPFGGVTSPSLILAQKEIPQTTILMGQVGIEKGNPDLQALRVMNFILGGGGFNSRLMREVRSNRGLAYSVYSYFQVGRLLPGPFIAGAETKSASTMEVVGLMRALIGEMRESPVPEADLQLAKESLINSFVFAFTDSHDIVTQRLRLDFFDYPDGYLETYRDKVAAVTGEDVLRVARRYLDPDRQIVVLVGDEAALDAPPSSLGLPVRPAAQID